MAQGGSILVTQMRKLRFDSYSPAPEPAWLSLGLQLYQNWKHFVRLRVQVSYHKSLVGLGRGIPASSLRTDRWLNPGWAVCSGSRAMPGDGWPCVLSAGRSKGLRPPSCGLRCGAGRGHYQGRWDPTCLGRSALPRPGWLSSGWDAPERAGEHVWSTGPCPGGPANDPVHSGLHGPGNWLWAGPLAGILPMLTHQSRGGRSEKLKKS